MIVGRRSFLLSAAFAIALAGCGGARFDEQARDICLRNDAIDAEAAQILPQRDIVKDLDYPEKIQHLVQQKQALKNEIDGLEAPMSRSTLQSQLSVALNNSMRYLRALEKQWSIAREDLDKMGAPDQNALGSRPGLAEAADDALVGAMSELAAARTDPREVMMKRQYERMYTEVRAKLGLPPIEF